MALVRSTPKSNRSPPSIAIALASGVRTIGGPVVEVEVVCLAVTAAGRSS